MFISLIFSGQWGEINWKKKFPLKHLLMTGSISRSMDTVSLASQLALGLGYEAIQSDTLTENLRKGIIEKNRLFFHRWRPANETYLYLFRKHEQGNNAKEIPQFDPIIEEREKEIEAIRSQLAQRFPRII